MSVENLAERERRIGDAVALLAASWPRAQLGDIHVRALISGLMDIPADDVVQAVEFARRTMHFPPSLAELRTIVAHLRLGLPEPARALEMVQAYVAERRVPKFVPCPASCDDGWVPGSAREDICEKCGGEARVPDFKVTLPDPVRRALLAIGGQSGWSREEDPGFVRREFVRYYEQFRQEAERQVIVGDLALPAPDDGRKELTA